MTTTTRSDVLLARAKVDALVARVAELEATLRLCVLALDVIDDYPAQTKACDAAIAVLAKSRA